MSESAESGYLRWKRGDAALSHDVKKKTCGGGGGGGDMKNETS